MSASTNPVPLRTAGVRSRSILTAIFAIALASLVAERLAYAGLFEGHQLRLGTLAEQAASSLASIVYLVALWRLRQAASSVARGEAFGPEAIAAMRAVGWLLVAGSACALCVVPLLGRLFAMPQVRQIDADVATLVIGAIGVGQILIGGMLRRAASNERELADFF